MHFIGIGGIGMSSLAQYFLAHNFLVTGSDLHDSEIIRSLRARGASITVGAHTGKNIPKNPEKIIISNAIDEENIEYKVAKKRGYTIQTYPEVLAALTKKYTTIAVCGAHGKSTTTALVSLLLERAGLDPTVIIGTKLYEWNGDNFRNGEGKYLVLEADEYKEAFLEYHPSIILATNIDREHLDHYTTFENVQKAFKKFLNKVPKNGTLILNKDDVCLRKIGEDLKKKKKKIVWYSLHSSARKSIASVLKISGLHNISNALGAFALSKILKIPEESTFDVLRNFKGSWRRSDYKGRAFGAEIFDDYAHHPTEIHATLSAFREAHPTTRIWCVFQPHQQKRLENLFDDFVKAFYHADRVVLLDTYQVFGRDFRARADKNKNGKKADLFGERESKKTAFDLACALNDVAKKSVFHIRYTGQLPEFLKQNVFEGDIVLMMGAGDINEITKTLIPIKNRQTIY